MSGHSKWHKIQHKKGKADKARSGEFTKLLRAVMVAAQQGGGDPEMNFSLRLAVQKAKAGNVPKDNIDRAIKRGTGEDKDGAVFETALYEGFGPGGVAMLIECLTDNKNRTVADVKYILTKHGGSMAGPGSVQWQFDHKGVVRLANSAKAAVPNWGEFQLSLMDAGAEDLNEYEEGVELLCQVSNLKDVLDALGAAGIEPEDSGLEWVPKEPVEVDEATEKKVDGILEKFEENDDVREVYTNIA